MSSFEEQTALLEEYEKWKGEKKVSANDLSPSAFLVDRAKQAAYEQLEDTLKEVDLLNDKLDRIKKRMLTVVPVDFKDYGQANDIRKIINETAPDELEEF